MQHKHDPEPENSIRAKEFEKPKERGKEGAYLLDKARSAAACDVGRSERRTEDAKSTLRASPSVGFLVALSSASVDIAGLWVRQEER